MGSAIRNPFLTAEWRTLVMFNYDVPRELLEPRVPAGTVLDTYRGRTYVTLVGFRFLNTQVKGLSIPGHRDFEELNLRFYVRRFSSGEWRRGVVFIREIVPRAAIALTARLAYNEPYAFRPMRHEVRETPESVEARFEWNSDGRWHSMSARGAGPPAMPATGSLEEFIVEHYWGYTRQRDGGTMEYPVEHPSWRLWSAGQCRLDAALEPLYGPELARVLSATPPHGLIAEGSPVSIGPGRLLPLPAGSSGSAA